MRRSLLLLLLAGFTVSWLNAQDSAKPDPLELGIFGIGSCHTNNRNAGDNQRWMPQMAEAGLRYHRTAHTGWNALETQPSQWNWQELDAQMDYLDGQHMVYGGILIGSPEWNTADKPGSLPVHNIKGWSHYVTETVNHCKARIRRWEVWNEPPNFTSKDQTPADYAKLVVAAYDAAKSADPGCQIGLAAKSAHLNYLEQVIKAGAKDHFDYITLHPYEILGTVADNAGTEPVFMNIVPSVRKMLAVQNPAKAGVPIIFTELGHDTSKGTDIQAQALVKAYTMGAAQGVACIQWFEGRDGDSGPMGLLDGKGQPRRAYTAIKELIAHLGQHPAYLGWVTLGGNHRGFVFEGSAGPVLVAWAQNAGTCEIKPGPEAQAGVPIIFTELGHDTSKGTDIQAQALVKAYTMGAAQGVACIQWFEGRDGDSGPMGLLDGKGQPRPAYTAIKELIAHLGQHPAYLGWVTLGGNHRGFVFEGSAGPVLVAWAQNAGTCEIKPGPEAQAIDPLTGQKTAAAAFTLTSSPVLFTNLSRALVTEAKTNRNKPMNWWGADYSNASSVSLSTGENQKLDGLRTLSGDSVAKSVIAYGGSARAGGVPGGNVFVVDPSFLSYASEPIEITVVCRRNEANDNAGFKLVYESPTGFKTAGGWFTIPDNQTWHTARFRLEDPQFVNYWGYNFSLESDGNVFNRYYLQSVEVRKVEKAD